MCILVPYLRAAGSTRLACWGRVIEEVGQSVIVENRPGAGGTIASQVLTKSPPDGYTLIVVASGHAINPFLYARLPYDTFSDFTPISLLASSPNILLVRADSPIKTLADLLRQAREKPGSLSYGMAGNGTSTHLAGELLKHLTKGRIAAIPTKAVAPVINDLIGGISRSRSTMRRRLGQIRGGTLRALGVTSATRSPCCRMCRRSRSRRAGLRPRRVVGLARAGNLPAEITAKIARDSAEALRSRR